MPIFCPSEVLEEAVWQAYKKINPREHETVLLTPRLELPSIAYLMALLLRKKTVVLLHGQNLPLADHVKAYHQKNDGYLQNTLPDLLPKSSDSCSATWQSPQGKVILCSSGTTGPPKQILIDCQALWHSAQTVTESWPSHACMALQLPLWHVAGLAALIRAWVRRTPMIIGPSTTLPLVGKLGPTHASVVPSQLKKWWREGSFTDLETMRSQMVELLLGGGSSPKQLLDEALEQGWPLRLSYAMSEACSTIAMTPPGNPHAPYQVLPHWEWAKKNGCLAIKGPSLACGLLTDAGFQPLSKRAGWWCTSDEIELEGPGFRWKGRRDRVIISGGEKISPERLEQWLYAHGATKAWVIKIPDPLWGERPIGFVSISHPSLQELLAMMQKELGTRFSCDHLLQLPLQYQDLDKLPREFLEKLWLEHLKLSQEGNRILNNTIGGENKIEN